MNNEAIKLLKNIISIPSISRQEKEVADFLQSYLESKGLSIIRVENNLISVFEDYDPQRPNLILNSHIDTVMPNNSYTRDPFEADSIDGKIYGLGSNDAGASVVSLIQSYIYFQNKELEFNLILLLSSEEEIGGENGIIKAIENLPEYFESNDLKVRNYAIIGEPTEMCAAIAERGLIVVDAVSYGESSHAAHGNGINAIDVAIKDIQKIKEINFDRESVLMGKPMLNVCQIKGGMQHNIIPDRCQFVIDIRPNDQYTNKEIIDILSQSLESELTARSLRNKTSISPINNPLLKTAKKLGIKEFISNTGSDWMKVNFTALKMGVGDSLRSHRADEYVYESEIKDGIEQYINFVKNFTI